MLEEKKTEAQRVLDGLLKEGLIPFELSVGSLLNRGPSEYTVHFYDSRIHSVEFTWTEGQSFEEIFRAAVLDRVARMSGPLHKK